MGASLYILTTFVVQDTFPIFLKTLNNIDFGTSNDKNVDTLACYYSLSSLALLKVRGYSENVGHPRSTLLPETFFTEKCEQYLIAVLQER